jgi:cytochrome bd-type quinol oxidase subunit 1
MASLLDQINSIQSDNKEVEEEVGDQIKKQHAKDQSRIAWVIIWAFVAAVGIIFLYVIVELLFGSGCREGQTGCTPDRWKEPAKFLLGIVSSVLLPVVTLVLGYYFGKEKND